MKKSDVIGMVRGILKEMGIDEELSRDFAINDNLVMIGLDSIRFIEFVIIIEQKFNIVIEDSVLTVDNFSTIEKISNYLVDLLKEDK